MEAWKEEIASGKLPFESAAAARENLKRKQKDTPTVLKWHANVLKCRIFRHFRQEIIAYFS